LASGISIFTTTLYLPTASLLSPKPSYAIYACISSYARPYLAIDWNTIPRSALQRDKKSIQRHANILNKSLSSLQVYASQESFKKMSTFRMRGV